MSSVSDTRRLAQIGKRPAVPSLSASAGSLWRSALATPWPVTGFLLSLAFPLHFDVGALHFLPYRVWLLATFIPSALAVFGGRVGRILPSDYLMLLHGVWMIVALSYHHGPASGFEGGGIMMVEIVGAYLLARAHIRTPDDLRATASVVVVMCAVLVLPCLVESLGGYNCFANGHPNGRRLGMFRARGPFSHAIHLGMFGASGGALAWVLTRQSEVFRKCLYRAAVLGTVVCSVSSGALAASLSQILLVSWQRLFRRNPAKWKYLLGLMACAYVAVDVLSNRTPLKVGLHYLTFSAHTAYNRLIIWEYGKWDVINNPIFGIGLNVWSKPEWMTYSDSMDNFWLVVGVRYGLPGFLSRAGAIVYLCWRAGRLELLGLAARMRTAWVIMMIGMAIGASTVHFWEGLFAYYGLLIGLGAAFLAPPSRDGTVGPDVRTGSRPPSVHVR